MDSLKTRIEELERRVRELEGRSPQLLWPYPPYYTVPYFPPQQPAPPQPYWYVTCGNTASIAPLVAEHPAPASGYTVTFTT